MNKSTRFDFVGRRYLTDYDVTSGKVSSEDYVIQKTPLKSQAIAWNPLASYHMIRRFSIDLKALLQNLNLTDLAHLRKLLVRRSRSFI